MRAVPSIIRERILTIDRISPCASHEIRDTSIKFDIEQLARLNEAEIGEINLRVEVEGLEVITEKLSIDLLARDEWGGTQHMAQILAAFVSPNEPAVGTLLKQASILLEAKGHDGSMNGSQSQDPHRVYMLAGAIWSAATGLGLTYAEPPASFEQEGQKIRGPSRIVSEGLATCLDSSLFLAAAFEAAGIKSAILFSNGHAWVGVWLCKKDFSYITEPDVVAVRKAVQMREFLPIETTLLTKRPSIGFEQAIDEGRRRLSEEREHEFVMAVDIARSRAAKIRPLASHTKPSDPDNNPNDEVEPSVLPEPPSLGQLPVEEDIDGDLDADQNRIERWQRKLLDLSLRNRLLNYRDSLQTLPLRCPNIATLEDDLAKGIKFCGLSLNDEDPIGQRDMSPEDAQRIEEEFIRNAFERRQLVVPLTKKDMNDRFLKLFRKANSDMQEGGANTLFLAAGFLRWKKIESDTQTYRAPLLLVPITIERSSIQSKFKIVHYEDDVQINSTLLEFLKRDFSIKISELEGELPRDSSGIDIDGIFKIVRQKVREIRGFEVVEEIALSTFSFAKYLMWKDLTERTNQLRKNRLIRHLIDGSKIQYEQTDKSAIVTPEEIDQRISPRELLTPLPADSSQLAAVVALQKVATSFLLALQEPGRARPLPILSLNVLVMEKLCFSLLRKWQHLKLYTVVF